MIGKMEPKSA